MRGQRVKNIVRELNNEKVDVIPWSSGHQNVLSRRRWNRPKLKSIELDEAGKRVKILVSEDQLSLAIGKRGQNARLTAKLTGWEVDIDAEVIVTKGFEEKVAEAVELRGDSRNFARTGGRAGPCRSDAAGRFVVGGGSDIGDIPQSAKGGGDFEGGARRGGTPHVESRRSTGE
jgi:hypothetical protein